MIPRPQEHGVALVTTMVILAVMAVVAVALMQGVTSDRSSANSTSNFYRAQLAADAGAAAGRAAVASLIARYPDSATVWQNIGGGLPNGTSNEATVLYMRVNAANPISNQPPARPEQFGTNVAFYAAPLISRQGSDQISLTNDPVPVANIASSLSPAIADFVNLNLTNTSRPEPFIGLRSMTNPGAPVTGAQWVYLTRYGGPTNTTNPYVARFAYWIEDESFKVNVNVATNGPRGTGTNVGPGDVRLDGSWQSSPSLSNANFGTIMTDRTTLGSSGFPSAATAGLAGGLASPSALAEMRFLTTTTSAGLDLSRGGFKRFNINSIINGDKRAALDRVVTAITNTNASPNFGQRFYRSGINLSAIGNFPVSQDDAQIYVQKIAANLYDYIDSDDQPTIINNDTGFTLRQGPTNAGIGPVGQPVAGPGLEGTNSVAAMGVENLPRLQEYAVHARIRKMQWDPNNPNSFGYSSSNTNPPSSATFEIWIDHYFEFWNPGTRDIVLANAGLCLLDQPAFQGASGPLGQERDITNIPINTITFPAGGIVVLTTAPLNEASIGSGSNALVGVSVPIISLAVTNDADRKFTGNTTRLAQNANGTFVSYTNVGPAPTNPAVLGYDRLFQVAMASSAAAGVIITNGQGLLESFYGLTWSPITNGWPLAVSDGYILDSLDPRPLGAGNNDLIRASSLRGSWDRTSITAGPNPAEGDPRTLNEQLSFTFQTNVEAYRTSFYMTLVNGVPNATPGGPNFGAPNTNYIAYSNGVTLTWLDPTSFSPGASNAPLFVRNGQMQTIGELGHITDPARTRGGLNERFVRGGGRTLRVGQPEIGGSNSTPTNAAVAWALGSVNQTNAARTWTSWRLADIFTVTTNTNYAITDTNAALRALRIPGAINPNGALRDNGAALSSALFGLVFGPSPTTNSPLNQGANNLAGQSAVVSSVAASFITRLTTNPVTGLTGLPQGALNPIWERGELSELSLFNLTNTLSGLNMSNVFDRGREELMRRTIEMITPRGSVFTVYVLGQSLQVTGTTTNVGATVRMKQTFELTPAFSTNTAWKDDFSPGETEERFEGPASFNTTVLSTAYD
jgi:hypothetical protein